MALQEDLGEEIRVDGPGDQCDNQGEKLAPIAECPRQAPHEGQEECNEYERPSKGRDE